MKSRARQVAQEVKKVIAACLATEAGNPIFVGIAITDVELSVDLAHAKVYFTHWHQSEVNDLLAQNLAAAVPWLQQQIGKNLHLRKVPKIRFFEDKTPYQSAEIESLLRQIR